MTTPNGPSSVTLTPTSGGTTTLVRANPTFTVTIAANATNDKCYSQFQWCQNNAFTGTVLTAIEPISQARSSGTASFTPYDGDFSLVNGTWYVRGRAVNTAGQVSAWQPVTTWTVSVAAPKVPTAVGLVGGGTVVTTDIPQVTSTTTGSEPSNFGARYQFIRSSDGKTFEIFNGNSLYAAGGAGGSMPTNPLYVALGLTDGAYTLRSRVERSDGRIGAWSTPLSVTVDLPAPPTPTVTLPADGSTVTSGTPSVTVRLPPTGDYRPRRAVINFSPVSDFSSGLVAFTGPLVGSSGPDSYSYVSYATGATGPTLPQGTWYIRAAAQDAQSQQSAWTTTTSMVVSHAPAAGAQIPANGGGVNTAIQPISFQWVFSDPWNLDFQTKCQVIVELNSDGSQIYDSGQITSAVSAHTVNTPSWTKDVLLRWKVRVADIDGQWSVYSSYNTFTYSDPPVVTITAPVNSGTVTTGSPQITWTNDSGTIQQNYRIQFYNTSGQVVHDSGIKFGATLAYTPPLNVANNNTSYTVSVTVTDQWGMTSTSTNSFTASYPAPDPTIFTVDATAYDIFGYVGIDWSGTPVDPQYVNWKVYRRLSGGDWVLIFTSNDPRRTYYHDFQATTGYNYEYAVTQSAGRSGITIEGPLLASVTQMISSTHYWLINPYDETYNLRLSNISDDSYTDIYDEAELKIINRGRKMNQGTRLGVEGTLTAKLRDSEVLGSARMQRQKLVLLKAQQVSVYLRNPFGDMFLVFIGNMGVSRIAGVGTSEFVDVTIPYREIM